MAVNYDALVEVLVPKILSAIRSKSKPVETINLKTDLTGITSLPAYDTTGGSYKKVLVGIKALQQPALDAAASIAGATESAINAANKAQEVYNLVSASEKVRVDNESSRISNEDVRIIAEGNRVMQESERVSEFNRLAQESEMAILSANDTADHPTYIGLDNYVYRWNKSSKTYDKTDVYVRGESFSIKRVYNSIAAMLADTTTSFKEGDFCLINTGDVENPDNAKMYVRNAEGSWDFIVDMSGAIGFTGKTPQILVGDISIGSGKNSVSITLSEDGVDADGNPKYRFNFIIPCLSYEDLTDEQIEELQRPGFEIREQILQTEAQVNGNEDIRLANEATRLNNEIERVDSENIRKENETARENSENTRLTNESSRVAVEAARVEEENAREENEETRLSNENTRLVNEVSRVEAENIRIGEENSRNNRENIRESNENTRLANEISRVEAESSRADLENERNSAEIVRKSNEDTRIENEKSRVNAETLRSEAELQRASNEELRIEAESLRASAESVREQAYQNSLNLNKDIVENPPLVNNDGFWEVWSAETKTYVNTNVMARGRSPIIRNENWWLWDDSTNEYKDSGINVKSDYVLTKEAVEGVLTGDISSHTHSHLQLVSGVTIKTINGESVLGEGDIEIKGGGAYQEVYQGSDNTTCTLVPNTLYVWDEVAELNLTMGVGEEGFANEYLFQFTSGSPSTAITLPSSIVFIEEFLIEPSMIYQVSILNNLASVMRWEKPKIENAATYSGKTITFAYPVASDLVIEYFSRGSNYTVNISSGQQSVTTSYNVIYINSITPETDNTYIYTFPLE